MTITRDIINDLLPLYDAAECSSDTRTLVDEYLQAHPEFTRKAPTPPVIPAPSSVSGTLNKENELSALMRTKRLLRRRTFIMAFAIFFSLAPLSVLHTGGRTYWLFVESPSTALFYAVIGVLFWIGYFVAQWRLRRF
jgi:hypothetical protein